MADLKRKSVRGGMITMGSQVVSIAIQLASTVILARLLSPKDYGVIAMVMAITSFAGLFRDLGLSSAAIQKKDLTHAQQSNLFWLNVAMGALLTLLVASGSPLVVWFYGKPELLWITIALSSAFLIGSLGTQHGARLVREMQFGRQAVATITGALVGLGMSISLAFTGLGYWALVWGNLSCVVTTTILRFILSPFRPGWISKGSGVRDMLKFGANVTAFDFVNYFHRNLDNILIGKFWGSIQLGYYSRAYSLLMLPINSLRGPINAIGFPALSRLQDQPDAYRNYYRKVTCLLALISMPFGAFLFVTAKSIIALALGPQWDGIVPIFAILATVGFVQPVITLWGMVVLSRGMGRRYLHLGVFNTLCSVIGFAAGLRWGPIGVATGYAIVTYLSAYPILRWAFIDTPLSFMDFLSSCIRPFVASIASTAACALLTSQLDQMSPVLYIACMAATFAPCYLIFIRLLPYGKNDYLLVGSIFRPIWGRISLSAKHGTFS